VARILGFILYVIVDSNFEKAWTFLIQTSLSEILTNGSGESRTPVEIRTCGYYTDGVIRILWSDNPREQGPVLSNLSIATKLHIDIHWVRGQVALEFPIPHSGAARLGMQRESRSLQWSAAKVVVQSSRGVLSFAGVRLWSPPPFPGCSV
jgi:hypothetical protein